MRQLRTPNAPPHTLTRPLLLNPLQSRSTPGKHHPTPNAHPKPLDQPRPRQAPHQPAHRPTRIIHQPRHMEQLHTGTLHTTPPRLRPRRRNRLHRPRPLHPRRRHAHTRSTNHRQFLPAQLDRNQPQRPRPTHLGICHPATRIQTRMARANGRILLTRPIHHHHRAHIPARHPRKTLNKTASAKQSLFRSTKPKNPRPVQEFFDSTFHCWRGGATGSPAPLCATQNTHPLTRQPSTL